MGHHVKSVRRHHAHQRKNGGQLQGRRAPNSPCADAQQAHKAWMVMHPSPEATTALTMNKG